MKLNADGNPVCWLAIKAESAPEVAALLGVTDIASTGKTVGFHAALQSLSESVVFITPPHHGWVLVFGKTLQDMVVSRTSQELENFLTEVSKTLGTVCIFSTDEAENRHCWGFADQGDIRRFFRWSTRGVVAQTGPVSMGEISVISRLRSIMADENNTNLSHHRAHPATSKTYEMFIEDGEEPVNHQSHYGPSVQRGIDNMPEGEPESQESQRLTKVNPAFEIAQNWCIHPFWFEIHPPTAEFLIGKLAVRRMTAKQEKTSVNNSAVAMAIMVAVIISALFLAKIIKDLFFAVPF